MPLLAGVGVLGGLLRDLAPDPEEIWRFSRSSTSACTGSLKRANTIAAQPFTCCFSWGFWSRKPCGRGSNRFAANKAVLDMPGRIR